MSFLLADALDIDAVKRPVRKVLDWCEYFRQKEEKIKAAHPAAAALSGKPKSGTRITLRGGKWVRQDA